jgi:hypothetical protein
MLLCAEPRLVIARNTVWRLPVLLTSSEKGIVGEVGFVDVDAALGELLTSNELRAQLLTHVQQLIRLALSPVG